MIHFVKKFIDVTEDVRNKDEYIDGLFFDIGELFSKFPFLKTEASDDIEQNDKQPTEIAERNTALQGEDTTRHTKKPCKDDMEVSQEVAADLAGVDVRTIRRWEKSKPPEGYPGRFSLAQLTPWANNYKIHRSINSAVRVAGANRPVTGVDMDNLPAEDE
ncbi:MAG: hypothetical protein IJU65_11320 [Desulfovibrio sp.]|nr:hypothetical protein [Desulfovibrio sp.]